MAKSVDAQHLKCCERKLLWVQVPSSAHQNWWLILNQERPDTCLAVLDYFCPPTRDRTWDLTIKSRLLYQLSYGRSCAILRHILNTFNLQELMLTSFSRVGGVMVAALVLGTSGAIRGGSSPLPRTIENLKHSLCWF